MTTVSRSSAPSARNWMPSSSTSIRSERWPATIRIPSISSAKTPGGCAASLASGSVRTSAIERSDEHGRHQRRRGHGCEDPARSHGREQRPGESRRHQHRHALVPSRHHVCCRQFLRAPGEVRDERSLGGPSRRHRSCRERGKEVDEVPRAAANQDCGDKRHQRRLHEIAASKEPRGRLSVCEHRDQRPAKSGGNELNRGHDAGLRRTATLS